MWNAKAFFLFFSFISAFAHAQLKVEGPYKVETGEYKFDAQVNPDILADRKTELWARAFWPVRKDNGKIPLQSPLIVFLHGNHGTCGTGSNPRIDDIQTYTDTGICPEGYTVTPNHEGYNYIAEHLASYGYIVFSINANRGINGGKGVAGDGGLNLARGRLILKHLELWNNWNNSATAPVSLKNSPDLFMGKIDFSNVGLMGHSRGGEGARAAYNLYYDVGSIWTTKIPQMHIKGIFEIAAVDGQTSRTLDADHVVWNQIIPVCDGDVSNFDGIRPFNRMMQTARATMEGQKSIYIIYGANHNFFNTEWQENESHGCAYHEPLWTKADWSSPRQQMIGKLIVTDFFRSYVGKSPYKIIDALNPLNPVALEISTITKIDRDFTLNPSLSTQLRFDDFLKDSTDVKRVTSAGTVVNQQRGDLGLAGQLRVKWDSSLEAGARSTLSLSKEFPVDISEMQTLDFRVSLPGRSMIPVAVNFELQLIDVNGSSSQPILFSDFSDKSFNPFNKALYQTIRIPIKGVKGINLKQLKSIKFNFLQPAAGEVLLAHVRFTNKSSSRKLQDSSIYRMNENGENQAHETPTVFETRTFHQDEKNKIVQVNFLNSKADNGSIDVAITFSSPKKFKIQNSLPILEIAGKHFDRSVISKVDEDSRITFYISFNDFMKIRNEKAIFKIFSSENLYEAWIFNNTLSTAHPEHP